MHALHVCFRPGTNVQGSHLVLVVNTVLKDVKQKRIQAYLVKYKELSLIALY